MALLPMDFKDSVEHLELIEATSFADAASKSTNKSMTAFTTGACSDAPSTLNRWIGLQWVNSSGTWGVQVAFSFATSVYIRITTGSTWGAWRTI